MSRIYQVWVLELAVLKANAPIYREGRRSPLKRDIAYWEIWQCFNTRREAVDARDNGTGRFAQRKVPKQFWRIRKYVPSEAA